MKVSQATKTASSSAAAGLHRFHSSSSASPSSQGGTFLHSKRRNLASKAQRSQAGSCSFVAGQQQRAKTQTTTKASANKHGAKGTNGSALGSNKMSSKRRHVASRAASSNNTDSFDEDAVWRDSFVTMEEIKTWDPKAGPATPLLDTVNYPVHMRNFNKKQLRQLAKEIRAQVIYDVSNSGGHLGASLGVVELTVALHYVFNTPEDKVIFDVGHQAYPHKILTGRRSAMSTMRKWGGLSGFTNRSESEYDPFGAGHSSTSISAGLGMAVGMDLRGKKDTHVVSVIGDGAITGGMAYEAMNNAGFLDRNLIVILNDNKQVSLPTQYNDGDQRPVGGLSNALSRIQANRPLRELREIAKDITRKMPGPIPEMTAKIDEYARGMLTLTPGEQSTLFEELGLYYIGPVDGHDLDQLVDILAEVRNSSSNFGPVLIHVMTEKGSGYLPAMNASDKMHGVVAYDVATGKQRKGGSPAKQPASVPKQPAVTSYTNYFADALTAEADRDSRVIGIHAAMGGGTGMNRFERHFASRCFDVGIAEQHAVTFAAGLACEGLVPFCAIYSTFLQRAYDQIVHDVALQKLPVRFGMDRAGLVGADGATHCGAFDVAYLSCLPNMVVMAPSNEAELMHMVATCVAIDDGPSAMRFPRGNGLGVDLAANGILIPNKEKNFLGMKGTPVEIGKGVVRMQGSDVALVGYGTSVNACLEAARMLSTQFSISATVVDARFCKPLDNELMRSVATEHAYVVSVEEGSTGGFGSVLSHFLSHEGLLDRNSRGPDALRSICLPDHFIEHGTQDEQRAEAGITASQIAAKVLEVMGKANLAASMLIEIK